MALPTTTILIVDDDPEVRQVLSSILAHPGYMLLTACDAYEALALLPSRNVDLLLTDVRMPGMSGFELARRAKAMRPGLRVIYFSGYAPDPDRGGLSYGPIISKPIGSRELLNAVT